MVIRAENLGCGAVFEYFRGEVVLGVVQREEGLFAEGCAFFVGVFADVVFPFLYFRGCLGKELAVFCFERGKGTRIGDVDG